MTQTAGPACTWQLAGTPPGQTLRDHSGRPPQPKPGSTQTRLRAPGAAGTSVAQVPGLQACHLAQHRHQLTREGASSAHARPQVLGHLVPDRCLVCARTFGPYRLPGIPRRRYEAGRGGCPPAVIGRIERHVGLGQVRRVRVWGRTAPTAGRARAGLSGTERVRERGGADGPACACGPHDDSGPARHRGHGRPLAYGAQPAPVRLCRVQLLSLARVHISGNRGSGRQAVVLRASLSALRSCLSLLLRASSRRFRQAILLLPMPSRSHRTRAMRRRHAHGEV